MTTDTAVLNPTAAQIAELEKAFIGGDGQQDAFARTERRFIGQTTLIETAFMPKDVLERNQIDYDSDEFKAAYPNGLLALHIAIKGVSVKFTGVTDEQLHIWIPLYSDRPESYGKAKGRRSKAHVVSEAFEAVYKRRPYGSENQKFLTGQIAEWGQHLGDAEIQGDKREWAWDIPRKALPSNFKYEGPVTEINIAPRTTDTGGAASGPGAVAEMSEEEAIEKMIEAILGLPIDARDEASARILRIPGLPAQWNQEALEGTVLRRLGKEGYIDASGDDTVIRKEQ